MALNLEKTDKVLGWEIHDHLRSLGIETPMSVDDIPIEVKIEDLTAQFKVVLNVRSRYAQ